MCAVGPLTNFVAIAQDLMARGSVPSAEAVAAAAGMSRASYYRVVGSHRALLREAGHRGPAPPRERIMDAAVELLGEAGISGLVMDGVADRSGVSRPALYRLFAGKAELIAEVARTRAPLAGLGPALRSVADQPAQDVLPSLVAAAVPRLLSSRGVLRAVLAEASASGPASSAARDVIADAYGELAAYLERQMDMGHVRRYDPLAAVQALLGPLLLFAVMQSDFWDAAAGGPRHPDQTVREIVDVWLRGMSPEP